MAYYDYSKRLSSLKKRREDSEIIKSLQESGQFEKYAMLKESYEDLKESDSVRYVIGAMAPVSNKSTEITIKQGERVKNHLIELYDKYEVEFRYQGSVTNNTHIEAHSDIDVLTLHGKFYSLEAPQVPTSPYAGDPVQELVNLREDCVRVLTKAFPAVYVDTTGAKCLSLSGGSLARKVDVVPSNWFNTIKYSETREEFYRGIHVLDYFKRKRIANTPFYHNHLLEIKDISARRNYKKMIRLLKTLKADNDYSIDLSSYDIAAILYHMNDKDYAVGYSPLLLIQNTIKHFDIILENATYRNLLKVPDGSRHIFQEGCATKESLNDIKAVLIILLQDIIGELKKSGSDINKIILAS